MFCIDRVDFIEKGNCRFCDRELKSRIAFVLVEESTGGEVYCGPTCLTKHAHLDPKVSYPDFTKASPDPVGDENDDEGAGSGPLPPNREKRPRKYSAKKVGQEDVEYLRLRYEKLAGFKGMRLQGLDSVYVRYRSGELSEDDRKYLANLIRKVRIERPEFSPENLATCYAYHFWLTVALNALPESKRGYFTGLLESLKKRQRLTISQIEGANNWLRTIAGVPTLDPEAFLRLEKK